MLLSFLTLLAGLYMLIRGGDMLVGGALVLARRLRVPDIVIGLTVVAAGTSLPELFVNLFANAQGASSIAIGNVLGSYTANILLVLGSAAAIKPMRIERATTYYSLPFSMLAIFVLGLMLNAPLIDGQGSFGLTRTNGLVLLTFLLVFLSSSLGFASTSDEDRITTQAEVEAEAEEVRSPAWSVSLGSLGLALGGHLTVDSAQNMAPALGVSQALIGLTIVAIGTSLPELVTGVLAARRGSNIAVGTVIGSNALNIFWVLGLSAAVSPMEFMPSQNLDLLVGILAASILFAALYLGERHGLSRRQGAFFLVLYAVYIIYIVWRG